MAFVKGAFYRCIDNFHVYGALPLTLGKLYECFDYSAMIGAVLVKADNGNKSWRDASKFDPTPVQPVAPSPVAAHVAAMQGHNAAPKLGPSVTKTGAICSCGKQAEKKIFATFEYWYCPVCKTEVGGKAAISSGLDSGWVDVLRYAAVPSSLSQQGKQGHAGVLTCPVVALKGEAIVCCNCGHTKTFLLGDLPTLDPNGHRAWSNSYLDFSADIGKCSSCGSDPSCAKFTGKLYVQGRGWV